MSKLRLFFAVWPPRETAAALHEWATALRASTGGRITEAGKIHLTLAFLGDIDGRRLAALKNVSVRGESHTLPIERALFWKHNKIVWVGPAEIPEELKRLVQDLHANLKSESFALEDRAFAAHITLVRKARVPKTIPELPKISWPVDEVVLVRSNLSSEGSAYEVLKRYPLS